MKIRIDKINRCTKQIFLMYLKKIKNNKNLKNLFKIFFKVLMILKVEYCNHQINFNKNFLKLILINSMKSRKHHKKILI